jgi:hypothetical protein
MCSWCELCNPFRPQMHVWLFTYFSVKIQPSFIYVPFYNKIPVRIFSVIFELILDSSTLMCVIITRISQPMVYHILVMVDFLSLCVSLSKMLREGRGRFSLSSHTYFSVVRTWVVNIPVRKGVYIIRASISINRRWYWTTKSQKYFRRTGKYAQYTQLLWYWILIKLLR